MAHELGLLRDVERWASYPKPSIDRRESARDRLTQDSRWEVEHLQHRHLSIGVLHQLGRRQYERPDGNRRHQRDAEPNCDAAKRGPKVVEVNHGKRFADRLVPSPGSLSSDG